MHMLGAWETVFLVPTLELSPRHHKAPTSHMGDKFLLGDRGINQVCLMVHLAPPFASHHLPWNLRYRPKICTRRATSAATCLSNQSAFLMRTCQMPRFFIVRSPYHRQPFGRTIFDD